MSNCIYYFFHIILICDIYPSYPWINHSLPISSCSYLSLSSSYISWNIEQYEISTNYGKFSQGYSHGSMIVNSSSPKLKGCLTFLTIKVKVTMWLNWGCNNVNVLSFVYLPHNNPFFYIVGQNLIFRVFLRQCVNSMKYWPCICIFHNALIYLFV